MSLGVDFSLPPERALAFFRAKGLRASFAWQDMRALDHDHDFTVAKLMDMELLADVRDALDQALAEGWSVQQFRDQLTPLLQAKGWWGRQEVLDPQTGELVMAQLGSARRLNTIFSVNMATAYAAGHWQGIVENAGHSPYLLYDAINDGRTRPLHLSWDSRVLRWDDPWWESHFPPNGWNCRCSVIQLNAADLRELGKSGPDKAPPVLFRSWENPRTGAIEQVPIGIDPGWDCHPGRAQRLARAVVDKAAALPAAIGAPGFRQVVTRLLPALEAEFGGWVESVMAHGQARGLSSVVGLLGEEELAFLAARGVVPENAGILVEDRLLVGPKTLRHEAAGNALSAAEWTSLPAALAVPEAVLWDVRNESLLYIFPSEDGRSGKLAVAVNYTVKKKGVVNSARTAFKVKPASLLDHIKQGEYIIVRGEL